MKGLTLIIPVLLAFVSPLFLSAKKEEVTIESVLNKQKDKEPKETKMQKKTSFWQPVSKMTQQKEARQHETA